MVVRIAGINMPMHKHIFIALQHIYGIGRARALKICAVSSVPPGIKTSKLTERDLERLSAATLKYTIEGDLRRNVLMNIKRKINSGSYKGSRHRRNLPVRGQRTKTNASTCKHKYKKRTKV